HGKGPRGRFTIRLQDEAAALRRDAGLRKLAALLTKAGHSDHAPHLLTKAAEADEAKFKQIRQYGQALCTGGAVVDRPVPSGTTCRQLAERWTSGELHRKWPDHVKLKRSVENDKTRFKKLFEEIGDVPLVAFRLEHAERAMAALPSERT